MKKIICLVGPSGSGKSTMEKRLVGLNTFKEQSISKCVSHTSRNIRDGEQDGIDYHFVSKKFFEQEKDNFLESVQFGDNYYGLHSSEIKNGLNILVVEPNGYQQITSQFDSVIGIYLDTSKSKDRMLSRGDSLEDINKRLSFDDIETRAKGILFDITINTDILTEEEVFDKIKEFLNELI